MGTQQQRDPDRGHVWCDVQDGSLDGDGRGTYRMGHRERAPVAHTESDDEESVVVSADHGPVQGPVHGPGGHRRVKLAVEEVRLPAVAWPTVALGVGSATVWAAGAYAGAVLGWPVAATLPIQSAAAFAVFTPMHDASHGAAAPRVRWINGTMGRLGAFILGAPFPAYRHVHMKHHKYTNDPERDPDYWSGSGPVLLLPFKWASQVRYARGQCKRTGRRANL